MFRKGEILFLMFVILAVGGFTLFARNGPTSAEATSGFIYWAMQFTGGLGRATLLGDDVNTGFITTGQSTTGVAVNDTHIYWTNFNGGSIGRAKLDGTDIVPNFIQGCIAPLSVVLDDQYVYWSNYEYSYNPNGGDIGRAKLDGTDVNQEFIFTSGYPRGLAVDKDYIYWASYNTGTIGRAKIGGTDIVENWINDPNELLLISPHCVLVTDTHIFWSNFNGSSIGRANLSGTNPEIWISIPPAAHPLGLAKSGEYIYWAYYWAPYIGRSDMNKEDVQYNWLNTGTDHWSIAITPDCITVSIDIKPGSFPNAINLGSNGVVPVAILSSPTFDATTVNPETVALAGAGVRFKGNGTPMASFQDVNNDGLIDIVVQVETSALELSTTDTDAILTGITFSGRSIKGQDTVRIVK